MRTAGSRSRGATDPPGRRARILAVLLVAVALLLPQLRTAPAAAAPVNEVEVLARLRLSAVVTGRTEYGRLGDHLYFAADDRTTGQELWRTDGTAAGTELVADISPGATGSAPGVFVRWGDLLYFAASTEAAGRELWRTDGTAAGTMLVADIREGAGGSRPTDLVDYEGRLYLRATTEESGRELWRTDGTASGTELVADINPGPDDSLPGPLTAAGGFLYFAAGEPQHGRELWRTDGVVTTRRTDLNPGAADAFADIPEIARAGLHVYFPATDGASGVELWRSNGTATSLVRDIHFEGDSSPSGLTVLDGAVYFAASFQPERRDLWRADADGATVVADIPDGTFGNTVRHVTEVGGLLYFTVGGGSAPGVWRSDGTGQGTIRLAAHPGGPYPPEFTGLDGFTYFRSVDASGDSELWRTDGTAASTGRALAGRPPFPATPLDRPSLTGLVGLGGRLHFGADDGTGAAFWRAVDDDTPPDTTIGSGPDGATEDPTPTFEFRADDPPATFECRVDAAAYAPCTSPFTSGPLAEGPHVFEVRATDAHGQVDGTPARRDFVVGREAPPPTPQCAGRDATVVAPAGGGRVRGTRRADVIVGSDAADRIRARGGRDVVCAGGGRDRVRGGRGRDVLRGQRGADRLLGGPGNDTCRGGRGKDRERSC